MERVEGENIAAQQVPVKGFEVSEVKENAVAFGNRPLIEALRADDTKELVSESAGLD
jgi:hypothetical protein